MIYAYAILRERLGVQQPWPSSLDPNHPVGLLPIDEHLSIVVSTLEEPPETSDAAVLAATACCHHGVVEAAHRRGDVIPLRFGTVFAGVEQLQRQLRAQIDSWISTLNLTQGCSEWDLELTVDSERLRNELLAEKLRALPSASPGRRYLIERAVDRDLTAVAAQRSEDLWQELWQLARGYIRASAERPNGHYAVLIPEDFRNGFPMIVEEINVHAVGLRLSVTGVWPPYSFVGRDPLQRAQEQEELLATVLNKPRPAVQSAAVGAGPG